MKRPILIFTIVFITLISITLIAPPVLAKMKCCGGGNHGVVCTSNTNCASPGVCGGICNPLGSNTMTMLELYIRIAQLALGATGLFGVLMFIYGGVLMLTSAGNPDKVKKAKDTLAWAVAGIAIIMLSGTIVNYVFSTFQF